MKGTFYGVGVGPGDPELLTLKAVQTIRQCEILALPISDLDGDVEKCVAYQIVLGALPEAAQKEKLLLSMPMIKDKERLKKIHDEGAKDAAALLNSGKNIAFITLGDPTVYSTCLYIHKRLKSQGYATALVPGVPSFCSAAARMDIGLVENREQMHIIPGSYSLEEGLDLPGTRILMKSGRNMPRVKEEIRKRGLEIYMVENCGMENERIYKSIEEMPKDAGYYSLLIVKGDTK
ncbi:precorrin-2/cobalt-factor-2 C20-methyltransferase [Aequitasia blattaphilus]|uniref:Precorrin-2 C(20)-methyltransferase n=1 Tax=Aequitasia blattaphilus TaxID=2949332 RepID=A0ABT1E990_9FIRM|nr:precorrin-2 C(20)-methyltransferase [Aequitasia blattaphilus]MCP1102174.1 precorrin-2 C(20)-methyltransferase [Aequitasia blattaphilus]MCR8614814.1 precorrin-2 C(20)-methyltransferase [Aequitasia blattaphilus]